MQSWLSWSTSQGIHMEAAVEEMFHGDAIHTEVNLTGLGVAPTISPSVIHDVRLRSRLDSMVTCPCWNSTASMSISSSDMCMDYHVVVVFVFELRSLHTHSYIHTHMHHALIHIYIYIVNVCECTMLLAHICTHACMLCTCRCSTDEPYHGSNFIAITYSESRASRKL